MNNGANRSIRRRIKPASWPKRCKYYLNIPWERLFGRPLFKMDMYEQYGQTPQWQMKFIQLRTAFNDTNFPYALGLLFFCIIALTAHTKLGSSLDMTACNP